MKKPLLIGAGLLLAATMTERASAQMTIESFTSGIPATWTRINVDGHTPSAGIGSTNIEAELTANAWIALQLSNGNICAATTSWFTTPAKADRWLITPSFTVNSVNSVFTWEDGEAINADDSLQVWISTTGGTTVADFTTKLYEGPVGAKHGLSLSAYNGQAIRLAFRNNSYDQGIALLDNVGTVTPANAIDASLDAAGFENYVSKTSSTPIRIAVSNQGAQVITSMQVSYSVDGGTAVSQTFTGLNLQPFGQTVLTFSTQVTNPAPGAHTIAINVVQANGAADPNAANNTKSLSFFTGNQNVERNALIEEFTSSTCVPCANFNKTFDPLVMTNKANTAGSKFNIVKYQMNWPQPGTDVSYNAHGNTRKNYYSVTGIPDHYTNGGAGGAGNQAEITAAKTAPAFIEIKDVSYVVKGDSLIATATIVPQLTITRNYKVHMAGTEYHYDNSTASGNGGGTTTQKDFYHVMRSMLGNGSGQAVTSWTAGTPQTFRWAHKWNVGAVTQGSTTYWSHPIGNASVVVFVQDETNKVVMQSYAKEASWPLSVANVSNGISQAAVYPNPATSHTSIAFMLESASSTDIQVTDAIGRLVYSVPAQKLSAGNHNIEIPTSNFASGTYTIKVQAETGMITQRFSVVK